MIWGHQELQPEGEGDTNKQASSRRISYSCPKAQQEDPRAQSPSVDSRIPRSPKGRGVCRALCRELAAEFGGGLGGPPPSWERSWCRRMSFPSSPHRRLPGNTTCQRDAGGPVRLSPHGCERRGCFGKGPCPPPLLPPAVPGLEGWRRAGCSSWAEPQARGVGAHGGFEAVGSSPCPCPHPTHKHTAPPQPAESSP